MKEIPILFSTPMVQAILAGRKTQTRRIINPQPIIDQDSGFVFDGKYKKQYDLHNWKDKLIDDFSRWMPEDLLWVRESCLFLQSHPQSGYIYKADDHSGIEKSLKENGYRWSPSIHMHKDAARIWLQVENIRVERVQDISEKDAKAEGILFYEQLGSTFYKDYISDASGYGHPDHDYPTVSTAVESYKTLWKSINGEKSWDENPWVWVIEYKVLSTTGKP